MVEKVDTALVRMWDRLVGAVAWNDERGLATFEFDPDFLDEGLDLAPLKMPWVQARRAQARFNFPGLGFETFRGMPGLLADALPDQFGNSIIDAWLARQGRTAENFSPVERLCYTGRRAMGALEFEPAVVGDLDKSVPVEVGELVVLARTMLDNRAGLNVNLEANASEAMLDIIRVGTSAGGGRPKAVIAVNDATQEVRSGQVEAPEGFDHWILKFDGVRDRQLGEPAGYGRIEYAYYLMATACGIEMTTCRLLEESDRAHFMTRRFDRPGGNRKLHMQSLCAMAHFDFNIAGAHSYEQAFQVMRELRLPYPDAEQQFRRTVFNIIARNQDDHTKNIAFLMDTEGEWRLSPAFDVTYAYNPAGDWTNRHQMTLAGKRDGFAREDLLTVGREMSIKKGADIIAEVGEVVSRWVEFAAEAGVPEEKAAAIGETHRLI
ncbi:MAG: type II toxin-antitoxin system HipA family toxin [Candidatus Krumholzibacteria bacterium]|nr:type II toxin-antitoxin system HipA family toxin [Candidatus Krumholzibacteria bacterium]